MKIFLVKDGKETGPFSEEEIRARLKTGEVSPGTYATRQGMDEWKPLSEVLPDESQPPKLEEELPPELVAPITAPDSEPDEIPEVDPNENEPDARRHTPEKEEFFRSCAWLAVGLLYLMAFLCPTELADGWGVLNFKIAWAGEYLTGSLIPLMLWPGVAGVVLIAAGFLLRGRIRGVLALVISLLPIVLILIVSGDGFVKVMEAFAALETVDVTDEASRNEAIKKSYGGLHGLIGLGAAMILFLIILAGVLSTVYFTILLTPHASRHLRPNSQWSYYFGLIGGVFLILIQLVGMVFLLLSFLGGILFGLAMVIGLALQITAVIMGFTNTTSRPPKLASQRALKALSLGGGGLLLILIAPLLLGSGIDMYLFKLNLWFAAAALVFPLGVLDLWLGKAADTPQNN